MYSPFPTENNVEHIEQENGIIDQLIKYSEPQKFNGGISLKHYHSNVYVLFYEHDSELQLQIKRHALKKPQLSLFLLKREIKIVKIS